MTSNIVPLEIYTEMTPNPESIKFVLNKMILSNLIVDFKDEESAKDSPLAIELFGFPFVNGVFITQNFVTITKHSEHEWHEIMPSLKQFIKDYVTEGKEILSPDYKAPSKEEAGGNKAETSEVVDKIKEALITYVQPAVEMDGGHIEYRSYENGIVTLALQGACSGCPSASDTLKAGIEALLKRMIPEVQEVVAEEE